MEPIIGYHIGESVFYCYKLYPDLVVNLIKLKDRDKKAVLYYGNTYKAYSIDPTDESIIGIFNQECYDKLQKFTGKECKIV